MFDIHALTKKRYIRTNEGPFTRKALQKAVMTCFRLRNKFLKNKTQSNESAYKKQRNYCVSFFQKEDFFQEIFFKIFL